MLLIDFMPIRDKYSDLVRIVSGLRGKVHMCMELVLRFDYGRSVPWVTRLETEGCAPSQAPIWSFCAPTRLCEARV